MNMRNARSYIQFAVTIGYLICLASPVAAMPQKVSIQRYEKRLINQINIAWHGMLDRYQRKLEPATIRVHFEVNDDGSISGIRVSGNRPNDRPDGFLTQLTKKVLAAIKTPPPKDRLERTSQVRRAFPSD